VRALKAKRPSQSANDRGIENGHYAEESQGEWTGVHGALKGVHVSAVADLIQKRRSLLINCATKHS
jgi:hypothetical protein